MSATQKIVNELHPELVGIQGFNALARHNSASRSYMFGSHISQRLVIDGAEENTIQTGFEQQFSKYTFNVKMPADGQIIKIIQRYPAGVDKDSIPYNPETVVIYENAETKEIDYFSIRRYASYHQIFGYKYDIKSAISKLRPGAFIAKDTIFADSPGVSENGGYMYGTNLNVAYMSVPAVSEDGVLISESALQKLKFRIYETRVVEFGSNQFPLNIYGSATEYKPFPDINSFIRDDGVLMMLRTYDNELMPVEMSIYDTMEPDFTFDKACYVRGGKGRVVDIKVHCNNNPVKQLPTGMSNHTDKYAKALNRFHRDIADTEATLRRERKHKFADAKLNLSPRFHRLVVDSLAAINHDENKHKQNLNLLYRKAPIDEYRIEFVVEYEVTPTIGFKLTDINGGKGVIVKIVPDHEMPIDAEGNRADMIMDPASIVSRMNLAKSYQHYFNSCMQKVRQDLLRLLDIPPVIIHGIKSPKPLISTMKLELLDTRMFDNGYAHLLKLYKIVNEKMYRYFAFEITNEQKIEHMVDCINNGIFIYYPIDNDRHAIQVVEQMESTFKPTYGPVSYIGESGQRIVTKQNVRIAPMYIMLLDKIADEWASVSTAKLQHFGVLSPLTKAEKFSTPHRNAPVRTIGETEGRIFAGYCGREAIAEMMNRSNHPATQRNMAWNILSAKEPTNIPYVVDRTFNPSLSTMPLAEVGRMFATQGFGLKYEPEVLSQPYEPASK